MHSQASCNGSTVQTLPNIPLSHGRERYARMYKNLNWREKKENVAGKPRTDLSCVLLVSVDYSLLSVISLFNYTFIYKVYYSTRMNNLSSSSLSSPSYNETQPEQEEQKEEEEPSQILPEKRKPGRPRLEPWRIKERKKQYDRQYYHINKDKLQGKNRERSLKKYHENEEYRERVKELNQIRYKRKREELMQRKRELDDKPPEFYYETTDEEEEEEKEEKDPSNEIDTEAEERGSDQDESQDFLQRSEDGIKVKVEPADGDETEEERWERFVQ